MSLFGGLMGDFEEDPIFGHMNSVMNSFFGSDPFGGFLGGMGGMGRPPSMFNALMAPHQNPMMSHQNSLMPFGFPPMARPGGFMQNMIASPGSTSFTSTSFVSMSSGPDGRPQIYQASSSTKTGPNGVMETKKTVQDSRTGVKKMAIGHHIYDRGHIIEREQNLHEGTEEERQDFINLEEDEAEEFNREFLAKAGSSRRGGGPSIQCIETGPLQRNQLPAIMPANAAQASTGPIEVVEDDAEKEDGEQPIIELPESPAPPSPRESDETVVEEVKEALDASEGASRGVEEASSSKNARSRPPNALGIQPRKPIRTHQASPLASGHSRRSTSSAHPYNAQPQRKAHRPMKGTVQHHNNSYHHNPQYERDNH